jgi:hypothetical protein
MSKNIKSNTTATNNIDDIPTNGVINLEVVEKIINKSHDEVINKAAKSIADNIKKKHIPENINQAIVSSKPPTDQKSNEEDRHSYKQTKEFIIFTPLKI